MNVETARQLTAPPLSRGAIDRLLRPRSIALVGVSAKPGSLAGIVLENLERFGFSGNIHLVHPSHTLLHGRTAVPSIGELPFGIDCAVLAIPAAAIVDAVRQCVARGMGGVVIFTAGFAEVGPAGRAMQQQLAQIALSSGIAIEGPNCLGYVNYIDAIPLTFAVIHPRPLLAPGIAVISQSGAMASAVRAALQARTLDVSMSISTGNEAANGIEDFIANILDAAQTGSAHSAVVAIIAEHIRDPQRFLSLARRARDLELPLAMLHPGVSRAASEAAQTHTGAMAGDHAIMRAMVEDAGVLLVDTMEELLDSCDVLMRCPVRPHGGVAVLGESGAFKALVLDYADTLGLRLPQPRGLPAAALNALEPDFIVASNPLDLTAKALSDPTLYDRAIEHLLSGPDCGALLICIILTSDELARRKMPPVIAAIRKSSASHAVLFAMLGEDTPVPVEIIAEVRAAGAPFLRSAERALRVLTLLSKWAAAKQSQATRHAPQTLRAASPPAPPLPDGMMTEHIAKDLLATAGLPVPARRLVTSRQDAVAAAQALGWPVVLKIQAKDLPHKSDAGGVILGLRDTADVEQGWDRLHANVVAAAPGVAIDGVLVEPMSQPGLELMLGGRRDPLWGAVLAIGMGGVVAEVLRDVVVLPAAASRAQILAGLAQLKGAALLGEFRGRPARDLDAVVGAATLIGRLLCDHPEIIELDVNPLMVFAEGHGVLALDAVIQCR